MMNHQAVTHSVRYLCRYRAARAAKKDNCEPRLRILCPTSGHGLFDNIHAVFKLLKGGSSQTARLLRMIMELMSTVRVQKFRKAAKGLRRKVWTRIKILNPNIRFIVAILREPFKNYLADLFRQGGNPHPPTMLWREDNFVFGQI